MHAYQMTLLETSSLTRTTNVASVPQLSPFRYPGGKTWFVPRLLTWIGSLPESIDHFIEPFAGGGIASLTVADLKLANRVTMVELDHAIAAVWQTIFCADYEWLIDQIVSFEMTLENVRKRLEKEAHSTPERAFQTILKNRTYHGGIIAAGSGLIKNGENGKGISSRWYPETLKRRILRIHQLKERITFLEGDAFSVMAAHLDNPKAAFFIDPPYSAAGKKAGRRLYNHHELDHERMFKVLEPAKANILITYDVADEIRSLAQQHSFTVEVVSMKNTHHATMQELMITNAA